MQKVKESTIERYLVRKAKAAGGTPYKFTSPGRRGVADRLIAWRWPRIDFVEVKAKSGRLSAVQRRERDALRLKGWSFYVLRSKEEVDLYIEGRS